MPLPTLFDDRNWKRKSVIANRENGEGLVLRVYGYDFLFVGLRGKRSSNVLVPNRICRAFCACAVDCA